MTRLYVNNFSTTISSVLSDASTTVELASVAGLPTITAPDYMTLTLADSLESPVNIEIVKVTGITGSVLSIERGQEGTSPASFSAGAFIEGRATATSFDGDKSYNTLDEALGDTKVTAGQRFSVANYSDACQSGVLFFEWVAAGTGTDDGGSYIDHDTLSLQAKQNFSVFISDLNFGVCPSNTASDNTSRMQSIIDYVYASGGGTFYSAAHEIELTSLVWKTGVYCIGSGYDVTRWVQESGTNADFIVSDDFGVSDIHRCGISNLEIDGNYFTSAWNAATGVLGNTSGGGIKFQAYSCVIDVSLTNTAGIGAYFAEPNANEISSQSDYVSTVSIVGKDFGKEGIVIEGPNDWILKKAFIGRAGILPRPSADTTFADSDLYAGEGVDGIVIDGANIEIGDVHSYACWSGVGFRTRNTVRLTKGGRVISESNNAQVVLSSGTYGSGFFDVRNLSLLHPNYSETAPAYSYPNPAWDAVSIYADDFEADVTIKRSITSTSRVVGTAGLVNYNSAKVDVTYSNSTAPSGDSEAGTVYSGNAVTNYGRGANINASVQGYNGNGVVSFGDSSRITFSAKDGTGPALYRSSLSGTKKGNNITGSINNCSVGFQAVSTASVENIDVSMVLSSGQTPFVGTAPSASLSQSWNITSDANGTVTSTDRSLIAALDGSVTTEQTISIDHGFLYTPEYQQVQYSIDDRSTVSTALDYCYLNEVTSTQLIFKYKYSSVSGASNHRLLIRVK